MRAILAILVLLSACSSGGAGNNTSAQAPAPKPTGPAPQTPVTGLTPEPGKAPSWIDSRDGAGDPKTAPYDNLLDQSVVNEAGR